MTTKSHTDCGCCTGIAQSTPHNTANRPGLGELRYRIGTHASFMESMQARLSSSNFPALEALKTRDLNDPSIALLDAWAVVADVLSFYNERLVNEGYLRTAALRRSVVEMAQLVGYSPRPGVSASTFLAYTLDDNAKDETLIPKGARAQSIPGPGELPQSFETSEDLYARKAWNNLQPRMARPMKITPDNVLSIDKIYAEGTALNLKTDDHLVFVFKDSDGNDEDKYIRRVQEAKVLFTDNKTEIILQPIFSDLDATKTRKSLEDFIEYINTNADFTDEQRGAITASLDEILAGIPLAIWRNKSELYDAVLAAAAETDLGPNDDHGDGDGSGSRNRLIGVIGEFFKKHLQKIPPQETNQPQIIENIAELFSSLLIDPSQQPRHALYLDKTISKTFNPKADALPQLLVNLNQKLGENFYAAWGNVNISSKKEENLFSLKGVYVLRISAPLFGYNAPPRSALIPNTNKNIVDINGTIVSHAPTVLAEDWPSKNEGNTHLFLDNQYENLLPEDYALVELSSANGTAIYRSLQTIKTVNHQTRTAYSLSGKTTKLTFADEWHPSNNNTSISSIRRTLVRTQSEKLQLAQVPITEDINYSEIDDDPKQAITTIELAELYPGLQPGRWLIISGERTDIPGTSGIMQSELAMLANVEQIYDATLPGDKTLSTITLAKKLAYSYKRDSVKIYGNVVKATNGETRSETLGGGDASKSLQAFTLKQPPLTYVSAANPSGIDSTLKVYVNDVEWQEIDSLAGESARARRFTTKTDDEGKTTVIFGNGTEGSRLPTGQENIKARYRNGIGKAGNVKANQISLLMSRPLGVKEVINPLKATGGADKETINQARRHAPLAVKALDRLVSVKDYEDFSRMFGGIGKASAVELSDGQRRIVHITIAGEEDIPIDTSSDLYENLSQALLKAGDPFQPIKVDVRELILIVISAGIKILPSYLWEVVVTQVRNALLEKFSFEARELGQDVLLGEVIATIQAVPGVAYVDVDLLRGVPEKKGNEKGERILNTLDDISKIIISDASKGASTSGDVSIAKPQARLCVNFAGNKGGIYPAQLAFLTPAVPSTLILNQIP